MMTAAWNAALYGRRPQIYMLGKDRTRELLLSRYGYRNLIHEPLGDNESLKLRYMKCVSKGPEKDKLRIRKN